MTFDAGVSRGRYELIADQALRTQQQLIRGYQALGKAAAIRPPAIQTGNTQAAARANTQLRDSEIAAARAAGENARALQLIQRELSATAQGTVRYNQLLAQQSRAEQTLARERAAAQRQQAGLGTRNGLPILPRTLESFGTEAIDQFKRGIVGVVGPAAIATAAFTALRASVDSLKQAFSFKAQLDATNLGIRTNLEGVRDSGAVFAEAARFADRYRVTQQETGEILKSSTDILRTSKSSVSDLEAALLRLQSRDVSKPISEAARALRELNSGDVASIKELFNVPAAEALRMKNEIAAGGDAVQVLNGYLDRAGVSMAVLENRSKGAAGAMNEQKIAQEQLTLAQAKIAESAGGIFFVEALTRQYQGLANLLNGDALAGLQATGRELQISAAGAVAYAGALAQGKSATEAQTIADQAAAAAANSFAGAQRNGGGGTFEFIDALKTSAAALTQDQIKKLDSEIATAALSEKQAQLERDSLAAANGMLGAGDQALILAGKYGIATEQAQFLIRQQQALSNATALADQRAGERDPSNQLTAAQTTKFAGLRRAREQEVEAERKKANDRAAQDAQRLDDLRTQNQLINAKTAADKIAILERQKARETDAIKRQELQNQIDQERQAKTKVGGGASKGLSVLDQDQIQRGETLTQQLQAVNGLLAKTNLTEHQRNDLLEKRRKLEEQITAEGEKQRRASIDAQLGAVKDAQARLKEAREAAGLQRALGAGRLSAEQSEAVRLRLAEINLEQQKRALDIQKDQKDAGFAPQQQAVAAQQQATALRNVPAITAPLPIPNISQLPPAQQGQTVVNITLNVDKAGNVTASAPDPNTILNVIAATTSFRNLSGGA